MADETVSTFSDEDRNAHENLTKRGFLVYYVKNDDTKNAPFRCRVQEPPKQPYGAGLAAQILADTDDIVVDGTSWAQVLAAATKQAENRRPDLFDPND